MISARPPHAGLGLGVLPLVALAACGGPPTGIPDSPGQIDADSLPDLISIGSPDLPFLLWLTPLQLADQDWRECPAVYLRDDGGFSAVADDCVDSAGIRWFGSASVNHDAADARYSVSLRDFGADGGYGGWRADGTVRATLTEAGTGILMETEATVTSLAGNDETLFWADTRSAYTTYAGTWYADRHDGWVGRQDWGTAEVVTRNTPVAFIYDCGWAAHIAGSMSFAGQNSAFVNFYTGPLGVSLLPPPPPDTGDTGNTGDTGDTGDTGSGDTDSGGRPDFDDDDDPDGACGTCRDASIGSTDLAECLDLQREFSWPFPPPF